MADQKVRTEITANASQAMAEWGRFGDKVDQMGRSVTGAMQGAGAIAGNLQMRLAALGATVAGSAFVIGVRHQLELMDATSKAAQSAGVASEQFSSMAYAARLADVSAESLAKAHTKLAGVLVDAQQGQKDAVELFRRLKLDPKSVTDADQLLMSLADRFEGMADGAAKTALAVDIFGERLGPGLVPFLNQGREGIEELRKEAARLGLVVSTEAGKAAEEFNDTLTKLKAGTEGMQQKLATAMLPTLQDLANIFLDVGESGSMVSGVVSVLRTVFEAVAVLGANVAFVLKGMGREIAAIAAQAVSLATLNFSGFSAISEAVKADGIRAREELDLFERRILGLGGPGTTPDAKPDKKPKVPFAPLPKKSDEPAAKEVASPTSFMSYYEAVLEQERLAAAQRDALHEYSKEEELAYWRRLQEFAVLTGKDKVDIARKTAKLEVDILRDKAKEAQAINGIEWAAWRDAELARVALDEQTARTQVELGQATQEELIAQELRFEERRHAIKLLALQNSLATLDPGRDAVKVAQINAQLEQLEQQHQQQLSTLRGRAMVESQAQAQGVANTMQSGFAGVLARIGTSIRGIGDLVKGMGQVVVQAFVQMLADMAAKWLVNKLMMKLINKATALGEITTEAGKAGAGGVASMAAAPFPLNLGAPAFGAGMAAAAMAYLPMASAAGGYDIPAGLNPMVQTHAREMILPATLGDTVRDMAQVYQGARPASGGTGDVLLQPRGASVGDFFLIHKADLVKALKSARKDLNF